MILLLMYIHVNSFRTLAAQQCSAACKAEGRYRSMNVADAGSRARARFPVLRHWGSRPSLFSRTFLGKFTCINGERYQLWLDLPFHFECLRRLCLWSCRIDMIVCPWEIYLNPVAHMEQKRRGMWYRSEGRR